MLGVIRADMSSRARQLESTQLRLLQQSPAVGVQQRLNIASSLQQRLEAAAHNIIRNPREKLRVAARTLNSVSPLATLERGYAIVSDTETGNILTSAETVATGTQIETRLATGALLATVTGNVEDRNDD